MALDADLHAQDAPRDGLDDGQDPAGSIEDEGYDEGGAYDDDLGDEAPGVAEDADAAPEAQASSVTPDAEREAFDAERAWHAFCGGVTRALDAASTGEFLARVLGAIARSARATGSGNAAALRTLATTLGVTPRAAATQGAQPLFGAMAQWIAEGLDDPEAFDAAASLFADEAMDEALLPLTALGARMLAGDLSGGTRAPLDRPTGRALLHAVAAAVRTLASGGERRHVRALPRLARSVARVIRRSGLDAPQAARRLERSLTEAARRIASSPELAIRLAANADASRTPRTQGAPPPQPRRFTFTGPVTLTISAR